MANRPRSARSSRSASSGSRAAVGPAVDPDRPAVDQVVQLVEQRRLVPVRAARVGKDRRLPGVDAPRASSSRPSRPRARSRGVAPVTAEAARVAAGTSECPPPNSTRGRSQARANWIDRRLAGLDDHGRGHGRADRLPGSARCGCRSTSSSAPSAAKSAHTSSPSSTSNDVPDRDRARLGLHGARSPTLPRPGLAGGVRRGVHRHARDAIGAGRRRDDDRRADPAPGRGPARPGT